MRHAMIGIGRVHARDIHQVRHDRGRGGLRPGACAVIEGRSDCVAFDQDCVHHAFDVRDQPARRDQRRMNAKLDPVGGALGDAQQLDTIP
jgi:hypothetical protein